MKHIIRALIAILALGYAFVSIAAFDCESISAGQCAIRVLACVLVEWLALSKI